jgi:cytochrome oxidase assembly protein ShyY1
MRDNFSEHLLVRNMALMYALQWAILGLTVVAITISAVSAAANWCQIEEFWRGLRGR